ncbi:holo-ACP synthase [Tessaracoccus oleiagri]|uniref:Holo-[acyl-carrier protein] synthase n=1 Tax=Tessaracoccus oleiagri TaxID=686624 RepID=A0A1G9N969_9ACTN|nr:4'-phosphopantetheinyl transferase superfamily protein [Tessaracoccus oleiagri]SDL82425.1 holo-[acyl-carrier protein] synthase [Tessaracoccus oleiagri]
MDGVLRGVGVDIVEVARIERLLSRGRFAGRWFTVAEVTCCGLDGSPAVRFARLLATKEAAWKALGVAWQGGVPWAMLEVGFGDGVGPVLLRGQVAEAASSRGVGVIEAASGCDGHLAYAVAFAWTGDLQVTAE